MITIDDYYNINFYQECLQALRNNNLKYKEFISTKAPFHWYLDIDKVPIMVNYDTMPNNMQKFLVNKVEPATPTDEYLLERRESMDGSKAFVNYVKNKALNEADKADYACFFNVKNRDQMIEMSKTLGKLYYFGKYYNNIRVGLCTNKMIKNMVNPDDIMVEKEKNVIQMELDLNFKTFRLHDRLRKFTEQPYFLNGKYKPVKIKQFNVNL